MPVAGTPLRGEFSWSERDFGIVLSALTLMYAVGQFINGQFADRFGTRAIATLGVFGSVAMNLAVFALTLGGGPAARIHDDPLMPCALLGRQRLLSGHGLVADGADDGPLVPRRTPRQGDGPSGHVLPVRRRVCQAPGPVPYRVLRH